MNELEFLFGLEHVGIKFGLENIQTMLARLGHPERAFHVVHVAGTNGKGSVTAMVDAALRAAGRRSARYTSPHLVDIRERFVIDGRPVDPGALAAAVSDLRRAIDALRAEGALDVQPTFFEVTTAVAFELFRRAQVDIAVIEVGLGGRLDATNVVTPDVTAITSIALDHEQYLGSTLPEIAAEKAGIIKPRVPVVIGPVAREAAEVIERVARERRAELVRAWEGAAAIGDIHLALRGAHQIDNAAVAVHVLERLGVPRRAIADGLANVSWPGRLELRRFPDGREALLDAAHNPAGAAALASYLSEQPGGKPALVFAVMRDKNVDGMFRALLPVISAVVVTRASSPRAADPAALGARAREVAPSLPVLVEPSPRDALAAAWRLSPHIVVAGSIFLLGDVLPDLAG